MRLREKLFLANLAVLLLSVLLVGWYAFRNIEGSVKSDTLRRDGYRLKRIVDSTNSRLDTIRSISGLMSRYRGLLNFFAQSESEGEPSVEQMIAFRSDVLGAIDNVKSINPFISDIRLYVKSDFRYEFWPIVFGERRLEGEDWPESLGSSSSATLWRFDHRDIASLRGAKDDRLVSLYCSARYPGQAYVGLLEVSARLEDVIAEVYAAEANPSEACLAVASDGRAYVSPSASLLPADPVARALLVRDIGERVSRGEGGGHFEIGGSSGSFLASYGELGQFGLSIVVLSDMRPMRAAIGRERTVVIGFLLAIFLALLSCTYILTTILLKRLELTVSRLGAASEGELDASFLIPGNDEVSELSVHIQRMVEKIRELFALAERRNEAARDAQMRSFYSQINAHFIYNTIENIKMMAEVDGQFRVADALGGLGRLLRYSLKWDSQFVSLAQEVGHIRNYLRLIALRFDFAIGFSADLEPGVERLLILKMVLQPLVENAVLHGLEPLGRDGRIELVARAADGRLVIELSDDGVGLSPEGLAVFNQKPSPGDESTGGPESQGRGLGVANVRERLALFFEEDARCLVARPREGGGLTLRIELPAIESPGDARQGDARLDDERDLQ
jgi:Predicted signal transduction protein with a C-terminal ATPase domain